MTQKKLLTHYTSLLETFIAFKSISTDSAYDDTCRQTASWLEDLFQESDFVTELWKSKKTHPVVYTSYHVSDDLPTVLIYGHYDVQPATESDGWKSDPFVLTQRKGRLYARGAVDNKGQIMIHIATILEAIKNNTLGVNVKFLIEGNEESGNDDLPKLLKKHTKKLHHDIIIVSDGETSDDRPTIDTTFRGGGNMRIVYTTADNAFHSGIYGGAVPSATQALSHMLAQLKDARNNVTISGFYTGAPTITKDHKRNHRGLGSARVLAEKFGVQKLLCEKGHSFYEQAGLRPTLEISGIQGGYVGDGFQNIVPHRAEARINIRTAPGQKTDVLMKKVERALRKHTPSYVDITIESEPHGDPIVFNHDSKAITPLLEALERVYKKPVLFKYCGGSIPIFADFKNILKSDVVSLSLGNEDCNMHGVDENFTLHLVKKGLQISERLFTKGGVIHKMLSA